MYDKSYKNKIEKNEKANKNTDIDKSKITLTTTTNVLKESIDVLDRAIKNGGNCEESSVVNINNGILYRGEPGNPSSENGKAEAVLPKAGESYYISIHSHPLNASKGGNYSYSYNIGRDDPEAFNTFGINAIVGNSYNGSYGISFWGNNTNNETPPFLTLKLKALTKMASSGGIKLLTP